MVDQAKIKNISKGYGIYDDQFNELWKTLNKWFSIMRKYYDYCGATPFDYIERTNVGLFASAIWSSGGVALEEFSSQKKKIDGDKYNGRVDLEFYINDFKYYTEFKQFYPNLTSGVGVGAKNQTIKNQKNAKADLAKAKLPNVNGLLGLFIVPYVNNNKNENPTPQIREYLNWLAVTRTPDVLAWWFPQKTRKEWNPGVILFLRRTKKTGLSATED